MKFLKVKSIALLAMLIMGFAACKKDSVDLTPKKLDDGAELAKILKSKAPGFQVLSFDANSGATVTTSYGTKFIFPPKVFLKPDGSPVTGIVNVRIKEIQGVSDMILANKPTATAAGGMLESFGEFRVEAQQGAINLRLNKDSAVVVKINRKPGAALKEIAMWDGDSLMESTLNGFNYQNMAASITQTLSFNKGIDWTANGGFAFFNSADGTIDFKLDSLFKWTNCDRLMSDPGPKTTVMGYMGDKFNINTGRNFSGEEPSMLFFKPKSINSIIKLYDIILSSPVTYQGLHSYQNSFPVGMEGTFLAISAIDGKFYAEKKKVTISSPGSATYVPVTFSLTEVSSTEMLALISSMNAE